jgi:hypothetical protein
MNTKQQIDTVPEWITETVQKWQLDMGRLLEERDRKIGELEREIATLRAELWRTARMYRAAIGGYEQANAELTAAVREARTR